MNTTTRIVLGAPITLGAGAAIQHFVYPERVTLTTSGSAGNLI